MTLTLLLDLDDTLLTNDIQVFLPEYLKSLSQYLSDYVKPSVLIEQLLIATQKMIGNNQPDMTLEAVFDASFYPAIGVPKEDILDAINAFYQDVFPSLKALTTPRKEAVKLVDLAIERNWRVAIATNPIFPKTAIIQRLEWAGFPGDKYHFDLIPSYESFHFAKPNPTFFAEALAHLAWPSGPILMVGNDFAMDIAPAKQVGLSAFYVSSNGNERSELHDVDPEWRGALSDLIEQLSLPFEIKKKTDLLNSEALLATLRSTPAVLSILSKHISQGIWTTRPVPDEWSLTEILCHLRDVDRDVNLPRLQELINVENPFLPGIDTDPWAEVRQYRLQNGHDAVVEYMEVRKKIISLLENLPPEGWNRTARHAIFGPTRLIELVGFTATHDQNHIGQWQQVLKSVLSR